MIGIYKLENKINHKVYIGQSVDINRRWRNESNYQTGEYLKRAIKKYGWDNFDKSVLEECSIAELNEREQYWINYYQSFIPEKGYNLTYGGDNAPHCTKLKSLTEVDDIITLLKTSNLTNIEIGSKFGVSDQLISDINCGRVWRKDNITYPIRTNKKNKNKKEKFTIPLETIKNTFIQQKTLEQTARALGTTSKILRRILRDYKITPSAEFLKQQWLPKNEEQNSYKSKVLIRKVQQFTLQGELLHEYDNAHAAGRALGCENYRKHILDVCHGKRKTAYGYIWKFKEE